MATTIQASFARLRSNLEITDLQAETTSTRQRSVRAAVERGLKVTDSFLVGSYARDTMIAPLKDADIDIFVLLNSEEYAKYRPAGLLDRVRTVLLETYPTSPRVSRNGQAVTITFSDFRVDVVPAFHRQGGGYIIPDAPNDKWISTDPTKHDSQLTSDNTAHDGQLIPLIKMLKRWNRNSGDLLYGFYLELLASQVLRGLRFSDYSSGIRYVLDKGREKIRFHLADPAGLGGHVNGLASGTLDEAVSRFTTAHSRAVKAEEFAAAGKVSSAVDEWRKIFGDYFPVFG